MDNKVEDLEGKGMVKGKAESKNKERSDGKTKLQKRDIKSEQYRVVISPEANTELELGLEKVRDGSKMLNISKSDIANFLFSNLSRFLLDADIRNLRIQFLDETRVLNDIVKKSQDGHELPPDLKKLIRELSGINDKDKKKSSRNSPAAVPEEDLS